MAGGRRACLVVSFWMVFVFLVVVFGLALKVPLVKSDSGTIYIRANGGIDPPTSSISTVDNVTYTFTDNIYDEIVVERSNIIIDGDGHTLQGADASDSKGILLSGINNVTIQNINVRDFNYDLYLYSASNNTISGNNITNNNNDGIYLDESSFNMIHRNNITNNGEGIYLYESSNNSIEGNNITNNSDGIGLEVSNSNSIVGNNIADNDWVGSMLISSSCNTISRNDIIKNGLGHGPLAGGIDVHGNNNTIFGNNISKNNAGVTIRYSSTFSNIFGNNITDNFSGIALDTFGGKVSNNKIYHNNFIDNINQFYFGYIYMLGSINAWDNGYPSGGNHWSDYNGSDSSGGPYQNLTGSDGIGDTPYVIIEEENVDRYPFMSLWVDITIPVTINDYDGFWHDADFTITLTATDESGIAETHYKINNGPMKIASNDGQPLITTEGSNNTLEYWSIDNIGNEELPHKILTEIKLDKTYPTIETPSRTPEDDILPGQSVKVSANVTDTPSNVKNVTLSYAINDGEMWTELPMNHTASNLYEVTIPPQEAGTTVRFRIVAYDHAGNNRTLDGAEPYCVYQVVPEFPPSLILPLFMILTLMAAILYRRRHQTLQNHI